MFCSLFASQKKRMAKNKKRGFNLQLISSFPTAWRTSAWRKWGLGRFYSIPPSPHTWTRPLRSSCTAKAGRTNCNAGGGANGGARRHVGPLSPVQAGREVSSAARGGRCHSNGPFNRLPTCLGPGKQTSLNSVGF